MKTILFLSVMRASPWGGSEEFWYRQASWMAQQGYHVECCFFDWREHNAEKRQQLEANGCRVHLLPNTKYASSYLQKLLIKRRIKKSLKRLLTKQFDLVCISQGGMLDITYPLFHSLLPILKKFILVYHNYNDTQLLSRSRKRRLRLWSHAASGNMVDAAQIIVAIEKVAGFKLPNSQVLINPITIPRQPQTVSWPPQRRNSDFIWVVLAALEINRKAQDLLLKVLAAPKWKNRNWQLNLYGTGPDEQLLSALILELKLSQKVFLKGHTNDVEAVLKNAHLVLQLTKFDAMPLSVTEAMNMARACIVSKVGDMPLWIEEEQQGLLAASVTLEGIDQVLEKAWQLRGQWEQMGIAAFNKFQEKYPSPYEKHYEDYLACFL